MKTRCTVINPFIMQSIIKASMEVTNSPQVYDTCTCDNSNIPNTSNRFYHTFTFDRILFSVFNVSMLH